MYSQKHRSTITTSSGANPNSASDGTDGSGVGAGVGAGFGAATIVFGFSTHFWLSMLMLALTGAFDNISVVVRHTLVADYNDLDSFIAMFTDDAVWEMPPFTGWYQGARTIGNLISSQCPASGPADMRMLRADANGQPAFALYMRDPDGVHRAFQIQVLTVTDGAVSHVGTFFDTQLFEAFRLPQVYPG